MILVATLIVLIVILIFVLMFWPWPRRQREVIYVDQPFWPATHRHWYGGYGGYGQGRRRRHL
jgi:hypothetical protein